MLFATKPVKFIVATDPAQTEADCVTPVKVGVAFTVKVAAVLEQDAPPDEA
ncbi:hypothetical protein D3C86_2260890 [compost metagenome]